MPDQTLTDDLLDRVSVEDGRPIRDPATGELIAHTAEHTVADLDEAITAVRAAQPSWAALGYDGRREHLMRAAELVEQHSEELARLLSREQGKPLNGPNARFEVGACVAWLRATASLELTPEVVVDEGQPLRAALPPRWCRRGDRPLELADDDHHLAGRAGPDRGRHRRGQAQRIHAAVGAGPGGRAQRRAAGRRPAGRVRWARRRGPDGRAPRH